MNRINLQRGVLFDEDQVKWVAFRGKDLYHKINSMKYYLIGICSNLL